MAGVGDTALRMVVTALFLEVAKLLHSKRRFNDTATSPNFTEPHLGGFACSMGKAASSHPLYNTASLTPPEDS